MAEAIQVRARRTALSWGQLGGNLTLDFTLLLQSGISGDVSQNERTCGFYTCSAVTAPLLRVGGRRRPLLCFIPPFCSTCFTSRCCVPLDSRSAARRRPSSSLQRGPIATSAFPRGRRSVQPLSGERSADASRNCTQWHRAFFKVFL